MPNIDYTKSITFKVNGDDWIKLAVREGEEPSPAWDVLIGNGRTATVKIGKVKDVDDVEITLSSIQQVIVNGHAVVIAKMDGVVGNTVDPIFVLKKINVSGVNAFEVVYTELTTAGAKISFYPYLEEEGYGDYNGIIRAMLENNI
ncbi:hypothetical protein SM033_00115 [Vibrio phage vB_VpaM_sm033]|nr:hypothetical protein SM033_00115 [Vibrio phage vB_VpaM_sm033]